MSKHKRVYIFAQNKPINYINALKKIGVSCCWGKDENKIKKFDGLLIAGGEDIDPSFYGEDNIASFNVDKKYDIRVFQAIKNAINFKKPILGICLGMQYINVYFGGNLNQDVSNHMRTEHFVFFNGDFKRLYGESLKVNSFHHQTVKNLGINLNAFAISQDGVVEGVENLELKIFGVQWHPERIFESSGYKIFETFKNLL